MNTYLVQKNKKSLFLKKKFFIPIIFLLVLAIFALTSVFYVKNAVKKPMSFSTEEVNFTVREGESTTKIGENLEDAKLIKNSFTFLLYLKYKGQAAKIQAGDYKLARNLSMLQIMEILTKGKVTSGKITIPEGWTTKQIQEEVIKKGIGSEKDFQAALNKRYDYSFLSEGDSQGDLQGFLFPETYFLSSKPTSEEVVDKMLKQFAKEADPKIKAGVGKNGLTYYEILTLASIVEREVTSSEDKRKVASVFLNRLENGIKLDSCATVEYVLGTKKRILSSEDIAIDSPYNTYKIAGLPPTPISNPGLESIEAVLNPENTDYIFFFSGKDGKTYFSKTQDEHESLKAKYL